MTKKEKAALEWLDQIIRDGDIDAFAQHARTIKAMLARPALSVEAALDALHRHMTK